MWTQFMDMHSGGGLKESPYEYIYIEASANDAQIIFQNRFGHNPNRVTCTCCGSDYSLSESDSLEQLTGFERGCQYDTNAKLYVDTPSLDRTWKEYEPLDDYLRGSKVLVIRNQDIKPEWREGELMEQGYIWHD